MKSFISSLLSKEVFKNNNELYLYIISLLTVLFCIVTHIYLLCLFIYLKIQPVMYLHIGGILLCCVLIFCISRRKYTRVGLILSIAMMLCAMACAYLLGSDTYVPIYFILVTIVQAVVPYGSARIRSCMVAVVTLLIALSLLLSQRYAPVIALQPSAKRLFMVSNIYILQIFTFMELNASNMIKKMVGKMNQRRITDLKNQAYTDPLTGLFNRRYADEILSGLSYKDGDCCVAMVDIDDFKKINDTKGHPCGDEVLKFLAGFLIEKLRKNDMVFRWGGEEFLIILTEIDMSTAAAILDRLRQILSQTYLDTKYGKVHITITIGLNRLDPYNPYDSIKMSDNKLYAGKNAGKNRVVS